jgi:type I restriction enzyme S subunit
MNNKARATSIKQDGNPQLQPKLRFPEFRDSGAWEVHSGDEIFEQINERDPDPYLPVLAITQEHGAIPRDAIDYHVSVTEKSIESYKVVQVGDFIISLRSFQGGIEYSQYHGICSPAYVILRRRIEGSDAYFKNYLKTAMLIRLLTKNLEGLRDGKMVSYRQFSELLLPIPSSIEQQKIADCLSSVDEIISAEARKLYTLKAHKQWLMQQLFPLEDEAQPRLRFPEFQNADPWNEKKLEDIAKRGSGHTPNKAKAEYYNGGIQWVSLADSKRLDCGLISDTEIEISELGIKHSSAVLHPAGSVILSRDAGVGKSGIISVPMAVSQHFIVWTCDNHQLLNWFLYYVLQTKKLLFERAASGSTIKTIGLPFFIEMRINVPLLQEQQKIAACLCSIDYLIASQSHKLDALKTHKKGLMQQLFASAEAVEP